jgi:hypothetical protein
MSKLSTSEARKLIEWVAPAEKPSDPLAHYRISILRNEPYQLPAGTREVTVLSGDALLVLPEHEYLLHRGEKQTLRTGEFASVSDGAGEKPLVLDMGISAKSAQQQRMKHMFYERMAARQQIVEAEQRADGKW